MLAVCMQVHVCCGQGWQLGDFISGCIVRVVAMWGMLFLSFVMSHVVGVVCCHGLSMFGHSFLSWIHWWDVMVIVVHTWCKHVHFVILVCFCLRVFVSAEESNSFTLCWSSFLLMADMVMIIYCSRIVSVYYHASNRYDNHYGQPWCWVLECQFFYWHAFLRVLVSAEQLVLATRSITFSCRLFAPSRTKILSSSGFEGYHHGRVAAWNCNDL